MQRIPSWRAISRRVRTERPLCEIVGCGRPTKAVDHMVPRAFGGGDDDSNLMALCHRHHAVKTQAELREPLCFASLADVRSWWAQQPALADHCVGGCGRTWRRKWRHGQCAACAQRDERRAGKTQATERAWRSRPDVRERQRAYSRERYKQHRLELRARSRAFYRANRDRIKAERKAARARLRREYTDSLARLHGAF